MLTASVSSNLLPTTTMSRLMKRARRATNKIQETCWGCILVVLLSSMLNDRIKRYLNV
jgi:histone H3/H4